MAMGGIAFSAGIGSLTYSLLKTDTS